MIRSTPFSLRLERVNMFHVPYLSILSQQLLMRYELEPIVNSSTQSNLLPVKKMLQITTLVVITQLERKL